MKRNSLVILASVPVAAAAALALGEAPTAKGLYHVQYSIYRINASISGETSLTYDIGIRGQQGRGAALSGPFVIFTLADLKIGGMRFKLDERGATWDGKPEPANRNEAELLASPSITTFAGQQAALHVGSDQELQYFERTRERLFELKSTQLKTGITVLQTISEDPSGGLRLDPFEVSIASVQDREPIEDVDLPVGKPILSTDRAVLPLRIRLDRPYAIQWRAKHGLILLILKLSRLEPQRLPPRGSTGE